MRDENIDAVAADSNTPPSPFDEMCRARREFLHAWNCWLQSMPCGDDVELERDGIVRAVIDMERIVRGPAPAVPPPVLDWAFEHMAQGDAKTVLLALSSQASFSPQAQIVPYIDMARLERWSGLPSYRVRAAITWLASMNIILIEKGCVIFAGGWRIGFHPDVLPREEEEKS